MRDTKATRNACEYIGHDTLKVSEVRGAREDLGYMLSEARQHVRCRTQEHVGHVPYATHDSLLKTRHVRHEST